MNSVDKFDQMRTVYGLDRKSKKWWHRIMFFFYDAAVVNAYVLYTLSEEAPMSMKDFRLTIVEHLVANKMVSSMQQVESQLPIQIRNRKPHQPAAVELTQSTHQPMRSTRRRCAVCSSKQFEIRTSWICSVCQVPLCLGKNKACFQRYHTK